MTPVKVTLVSNWHICFDLSLLITINKQARLSCHIMHHIFPLLNEQYNFVTLPCFKITFPKSLLESVVEQFQRRFWNWNWHSSMARFAPTFTLSISSTFRLQSFFCLFTSPAKESQLSSFCIVVVEDIRALKRKSNRYRMFNHDVILDDVRQGHYDVTILEETSPYQTWGVLCRYDLPE